MFDKSVLEGDPTPNHLNEFLCHLKHINAVKVDLVNRFTFKHHEEHPKDPLSPSYISLRVPSNKGVLSPYDVEIIAWFMRYYLRLNAVQFGGLCAVPRAGDPFVDEMVQRIYHQDKISVPKIRLEKVESADGRSIGRLLKTEGLPRGTKILLVDDLITRATSKVEALERLRSEGYIVTDCVVFLDRQQGGVQELWQKHKVRLHSIAQFGPMFDLYFHRGLVTKVEYDEVMSYQAMEQRQAA